MINQICECHDTHCPVHKTVDDCNRAATSTLYRIDMIDETGTLFCDHCADDAMDSGLFTMSEDDA